MAQRAGLIHPVVFGEDNVKRYIVEANGPGIAFYDYDHDGWLDVLVVNGTRREGFPNGREPTNHLYQNNRDGTFTDVTAKAGLARTGWGYGVCVGDYDNDGHDDLFLTYYGQNALYHNNGDGTFTEVTAKAGLASPRPRFNTGCTFVDYDRDGYLDLFVSRYLEIDLTKAPGGPSRYCTFRGIPVNCGPLGLPQESCSLYHNNGNGTFTEVTERAGISKAGKRYCLTAVALDYNNDGWPDLFVADDSSPNLLWRNLGNGRFAETAVQANAAFSADGLEQASMGVDAGDLRNRGLLDIFVTNFSGQGSELYLNSASHVFEDDTWRAGIAKVSLPYLGWSANMADFDGDGWLDILAVNGHVYPEVDNQPVGTSYRQKPLLFRNLRNGTFESIGEHIGAAFEKPRAGRGAALGDFDNDGDLDILINNIDGPPTLLRNDGFTAGTWLQVELIGKVNRDALGARVYVRSGGITQMREISSASGYLSSSSRRAQFSLRDNPEADEVRVVWPGGATDILKGVKGNRLITVREN